MENEQTKQPKLYQPTISNDAAKRAMHHSKVLSRLLARLDEPMANFDGLSNEQIDAKVAELLSEMGHRSTEDKLAAIGEKITIGGIEIEVKPIPAARASKWRRHIIEAHKKLKTRAIEDDADKMEYAADVADARFEMASEFARICDFEIPESATDLEVSRLLVLAQALNFPLDAIVENKNPAVENAAS